MTIFTLIYCICFFTVLGYVTEKTSKEGVNVSYTDVFLILISPITILILLGALIYDIKSKLEE